MECAVVVDSGTFACKAGFSSNTFPSTVHLTESYRQDAKLPHDILAWTSVTPTEPFDLWETVIHEISSQSQIFPIVLTDSSLTTQTKQTRAAEFLFECLDAPHIYLPSEDEALQTSLYEIPMVESTCSGTAQTAEMIDPLGSFVIIHCGYQRTKARIYLSGYSASYLETVLPYGCRHCLGVVDHHLGSSKWTGTKDARLRWDVARVVFETPVSDRLMQEGMQSGFHSLSQCDSLEYSVVNSALRCVSVALGHNATSEYENFCPQSRRLQAKQTDLKSYMAVANTKRAKQALIEKIAGSSHLERFLSRAKLAAYSLYFHPNDMLAWRNKSYCPPSPGHLESVLTPNQNILDRELWTTPPKSLTAGLINVIQRSPIDYRRRLYSNLIVLGGIFASPNFTSYFVHQFQQGTTLQNYESQSLTPSNLIPSLAGSRTQQASTPLRILQPHDSTVFGNAPWIGCAHLARRNCSGNPNRGVSREQFFESGSYSP